MLKMKKTFLIVWLTMVIILAISVVSFAEEVILRFSWWGGQDRLERTLKVIELFEEKYPNVKIEPECIGYGEYYQRLAVQSAGKNLPDIMQNDAKHVWEYVEKNLILNLDPYVENNRLNLSNVDETIISTGRSRNTGKLYAISIGSATVGIAYDPELFKKAGVEEPTPDWTWEDYIEKAQKIHKALGIYADHGHKFVFADDILDGLWLYLRQHGMEFYDESFTKLGYEDDSLFIDFYNIFADLVKDGVNAPAWIVGEIDHSDYGQWLITKQKAAMTPLSSNMFVALVKTAGRPLSLALPPNAKDQVQYGLWIKPSQFLTGAENSKYPEWVVKFIDFFTNDLEANKILLTERGVPISSEIRQGISPYITGAEKQTVDYFDLVEKYSSSVVYDFPIANAKVMELLSRTVERIFYGELTMEEGAIEFRENANKILAEK